jgi:hypothetical protein
MKGLCLPLGLRNTSAGRSDAGSAISFSLAMGLMCDAKNMEHSRPVRPAERRKRGPGGLAQALVIKPM